MDALDLFTVPEARETLALQYDQLLRGIRVAMLFPGIMQEPDGLELPVGFAGMVTPIGIFYFDPRIVSPDELRRGLAGGYLNCFLNLGEYSKADIAARIAKRGEHGVAVVEASPEGTEVRAAWGTIETANNQLRYFEETKTPGHVCFVTSPLHVIAARLAALN